MKRIFKTLALVMAGAFILASCEDVPAPYPIGRNLNPEDKPVVVEEGDGTIESPYNVAAALAVAKALQRSNSGANYLSEEVCVKGIISKLGEFSAQHGNYTYYISDDGTSASDLEIYRGLSLNGAQFKSENDIAVGDTVIVQGKLHNWLGTYEFTQGSRIIYLNGTGSEPVEIFEPEGDGSENAPYNVAAVNDLFKSGQAEGKKVHVKGIVTRIKSLEVPRYVRAQYYISDNGKPVNEFYIFNGYYLGGADFTSNDQLQPGDTVVVYGMLTAYMDQNGGITNEMAADNYLTYHNGQTAGPQPIDENNTLENPYTPEQALQLIAEGKITNNEVYVKGWITSITEISLQHGNATYFISADQAADTQLQIYRGYGLGGEHFTSDDDLLVGDEVIVLGVLKLHTDSNGNKIPEVAQGSKIVWLNGQIPSDPPTPPIGDAEGDGTLENPFNIPAANAYIAAGQNLDKEVFVKGIISEIKSLDVSKWERAQYYISDDGSTDNQFLIYNGYYLGGVAFTADDLIQVGDQVIVQGKLKDFQGTYEMDANNKIVWQNGQGLEPGPTPGDSDYSITSSDIINGATSSVALASNAYGKQAVADKSTWYAFEAGEISWIGCRMCMATNANGGGIQIQGNDSDSSKQGFFYNTTALPAMKTIVLTSHVQAGAQYAPAFHLYVGTQENPSTAIEGTSQKTTADGLDIYTFTYDVSAGDYTYLKIWNNLQGVLYLDKIEIIKK